VPVNSAAVALPATNKRARALKMFRQRFIVT
jgi:hypothetical protein